MGSMLFIALFFTASNIQLTVSAVDTAINTLDGTFKFEDAVAKQSESMESHSSKNMANESELPHLTDSNLTVKVVAEGLNMPTTMAFLGKDDYLILQKNGSLVRIVDEALSNKTRLDVPVAKGFYQGLLGIAVANQSNTSSNKTYVFLYYTEVGSNDHILGNRVYRYDFVNNKLINPKLLLNLPANSAENHGGYITIGPDNNLYIIIGEVADEFNETAVQTLTQNYANSTIVDGRAGILRVDLNGNPVLNKNGHGILGDTSPLNLYYAYGIHNGFGMDFDPLSGKLWDTEPGHWINDEINSIEPGFNSGYGVIQGFTDYFPAAPSALVSFNGTGKYHNPEFVWSEKVVPTGLKFLNSQKLGTQYTNDMFVGAFLNGKLYHFDLTKDRSHLQITSGLSPLSLRNWNASNFANIEFGTGFGGISSVRVGPDGLLYIVSVTQGKVYKISRSDK
jgi:glucose/arabinose dehydrogenase